MKSIQLKLLLLLILNSSPLFAQNKHIITNGIIEFEKTDNMYALIKKKVTKNSLEFQPYYEKYLQTEPQFLKLHSKLIFSDNLTIFTPIAPDKPIYWYYNSPMADQINTVFSDLTKRKSSIRKEFYERTFLVNDSLRKIKWKITDETRVIAGYNCRRANALVLDSIYVVAFYSDQIHVSGGPESFHGLPGMILGVAVPHENVTWFATKITETSIDNKILMPPVNGEPVNNKELYNEIMKAISKNGDYAIVLLKGLLL
jgi:GLPGLI family protein